MRRARARAAGEDARGDSGVDEMEIGLQRREAFRESSSEQAIMIGS
jgi:hypothetical protein